MRPLRALRLACVVLGALGLAVFAQEVIRFPAKGQAPQGYPAQYAALIAAAEQEGQLVIHSTTDLALAAPLIDDFQALYPRIEVRYVDMNSNDLHNGYLADLQASPTTADVLWSSAMDSQVRLASAGQVQAYDSPELGEFPAWVHWKNLAFGTTIEPIVIIYNKRLLAADEIPQSHADLARLLTEKRTRFAGKVVTYNAERSGLGFLLATQDAQAPGEYWALVKAMGGVGAQLVATTDAILTRVAKGDLIGYNALGSYACSQARKDESIGVVFPGDYTLVVTRVMVIGKKAANPNAARLWVDYLLSARGQAVQAQRAGLIPARSGVDLGLATCPHGTDPPKPRIALMVGPELLAPYGDGAKRAAFIRQWQQAIGAKP